MTETLHLEGSENVMDTYIQDFYNIGAYEDIEKPDRPSRDEIHWDRNMGRLVIVHLPETRGGKKNGRLIIHESGGHELLFATDKQLAENTFWAVRNGNWEELMLKDDQWLIISQSTVLKRLLTWLCLHVR
ncbi:MAG: hypothetical protein LBB94_03890 [Clostridiales bacterium]|jgi:hypothetical protein|nr:hypothetical protein [Clostridiales bacterium]